ncbi:MAG: gamma-glutamylcyclotransferase [Mameliella sp.]|nr:gamma-glutamylcyclotransferase [Mameliella sp.]|tara:strand:- start:19482 stop:20270 length:789 start_codon:yes stop_codon:yes gene_type:complete
MESYPTLMKTAKVALANNEALMSPFDPFRYHPNLRPLITPPEQSRFKEYHPDKVRTMAREHGLPTDWIMVDAERDAERAAIMQGRWGNDLWVFGYGSLMWDPGMRFVEVRRAWAPAVARRFILCDTNGGRGTMDNPGLMAALDSGDGCHGLAFRLAASDLEAETFSLWARERIGSAYHAEFLRADTAQGEVEALTFMANHDAPQIRTDLSHDQQVSMIASGSGFLGTSLAYIENLAVHLDTLRIEDAEVMRLLADVRARAGV